MMRRWRSAAAAIVLLAACSDPAAPPPAAAPLIEAEGDNVLSLTRGAVVVARTGEAGLQASAVQAIDSDPLSFWATPPGDLDETMTVALGGEADIRRIGVSSGPGGRNIAGSVRFEASADGASFAPLATVTLAKAGETWRDVAPVRARFLRVSTVPGGKSQDLRVPTLLASGSLRPASPPRVDGGWTINGFEAWFEARGDAVRGITGEDPPRLLEGGWDGPVLRLAWSRGNEHGVLGVTVDPSGQHLNGMLWYLWAHRPFFGTSWFGTRSAAPQPPAGGAPPQTVFLRSDGRYPLYGLSFAGEQLTAHSSRAVKELASLIGRSEPGRFRLVAHYVGTGSADFDRRLAAARLEALRVALREAGVDPSSVEFAAAGRAAAETANDRPWTPLQVILNNRVDIEIATRGPTGR